MELIVQKFGGTSVKDTSRIREVARRIAETRKKGARVVAVVSAMAGETDRLLKLARDFSERPSERDLDAVLSSGEQVTSGLLAIALNAMGCPAVSAQGHQIRILTDSAFNNARIQDINTKKISEFLNEGKVVVVAGFQGMDKEGNITTLGRGGSDLSAIALAHALKAKVCEIYTDVDGVYTADPRICPNARQLKYIFYEEMLEMASQGAKVLQTRSVEMAAKYHVPVMVLNSYNNNPGTLVCKEDPTMEEPVVSGIASNAQEAKVTVRHVPDKPGVASKIFERIAKEELVVDMIVQNSSREGFTDMTFTVPKTDLPRAIAAMEHLAKEIQAGSVDSDSNIAKVSVIGVGMRTHTGVASKMFSTFAKEGINIQLISTSEIKISCVIDSKYMELAVRALHDAFGLEHEPQK